MNNLLDLSDSVVVVVMADARCDKARGISGLDVRAVAPAR